MYEELGKLLVDAREQARLEQTDVARSVGLGQQAVSAWEHGRSRPRRTMLSALATLLSVPEQDLVTLGRYDGPKGAIASNPSTEAPQLARVLPLGALGSDRFEDFIAEIVQTLYPDLHVSKFGGQGEKQDGIDILVTANEGGAAATAQCKRHRDFGPAKVDAAVDAVKMAAPKHYLFLARPTASPGARKQIGKHAGWELWDGEDIARYIRSQLPLHAQIRLIDAFFDGQRQPFLGVPEPGPWLSPEEVFGVVSGRIFNYDSSLVGRSEVVDQLVDRLYSPDASVTVLTGRGGIGKTRLLRAVAEACPDTTTTVLMLQGSQVVAPSDYELLPSQGSLAVLIDDAHEAEAFSSVVGNILRRNPAASILIATRPYRWDSIRTDLSRIGLSVDPAATVQLGDLTLTATEALAREALGDQAHDGIVHRLARVTVDCPLITVVGGALIRTGQLHPSELNQDNEIRQTILGRFQDALIADPMIADPETRTDVLDAVAALQPVRSDDDAFKAVLEALVPKPYDVIQRHLRSLEDAGVIRRRGASLRIAPDLLGDVILARASWDERAHASTGYLDRVRIASDGAPLQHLFVNASRVDWQVGHAHDGNVSLVEELWDQVEAELKSGDIPVRRSLLHIIARVAYFQPLRAIELCRWLIENPTDDAGAEEPVWRYVGKPTYRDVLIDIAPVLKNAAYTYDVLPDALDLLWQLAQQDSRPTNQFPNHALRILTDLAEYQSGKPAEYNEAIIDCASRWFATATNLSPFELLKPILATEGSSQSYQEFTLTFQPFGLNLPVVQPLRERVIALALNELREPDVRRAAAAADILGDALRYPSGLFGREVDGEERSQWTPEFVETIERVRAVVESAGLDPVVLVAIRKSIHWHASYAKSETRDAARALLASLRADLPAMVALIVHDGWGHLFEDREPDYAAQQQRVRARLDNAVAQLMTMTDQEIVDLVAERLAKEVEVFGRSHGMPGPLVSELIKARRSLAPYLLDLIVDGQTATLDALLPIVLATVAEIDPSGAMSRARGILALDNPELTRSVAQALGWNRGSRPLADGERQILLQFANSPDITTKHQPVTVAQRIAKDDPAGASELLVAVDFSDDSNLADEVFMTFADAFGLNWTELTDVQRNTMWERLVRVPDIGQHWITELLSELSATDPDAVVQLMRVRVEHAESLVGGLDGYQAMPFHWSTRLRIREHPTFVSQLEGLLAWLTVDDDHSWIRRHIGGELFRAVAGSYDEAVLSVLEKRLQSNVAAEINTVSAVLRDAQRTLIWQNPEFVKSALHAADRIDEDTRGRMASALWGATISGTRTGSPGQPFREDIEQRDRSREIADRLPHGSIERQFYEDMVKSAESDIRRARNERPEDGRDW